MSAKGIFCIEGDWWGDLKRPASVEPILRLLSESHDPRVPYIHRNAGTCEELEYDLKRWTQRRYADYPILYLGFHGDAGSIYVGEGRCQNALNLDWFGDRLEGRCGGRLIHFSACGTVALHGHCLNRFLRRIGAAAVSGYREDIGWMESTAFEVFFLGSLQRWTLRRNGLRAIKSHVLSKSGVGQLGRRLGFRIGWLT